MQFDLSASSGSLSRWDDFSSSESEGSEDDLLQFKSNRKQQRINDALRNRG